MEQKAQIICDSDTIIDYFNKNSLRYSIIENEFLKIGKGFISISIITKMELIQGSKNNKEINDLINKLDLISTIYITEEISSLAFTFIKDFSKSHALQIPDALIAATAVQFQIPFIHLQQKTFSIHSRN